MLISLLIPSTCEKEPRLDPRISASVARLSLVTRGSIPRPSRPCNIMPTTMPASATTPLLAVMLWVVDLIETTALDQQQRLYQAMIAARVADPGGLRSPVMAGMLVDGMESALRPFSIEREG
jgi:hypothetical protein